METRKVEMYIGFTNYQWNTCIVEIPLDTPKISVLAFAELEVLNKFNSSDRNVSEIAFMGIYNDNLVVE